MANPDDLAVEIRQAMSDVRWDLGLAPLSDDQIGGAATSGASEVQQDTEAGATGPATPKPGHIRWAGATGLDRPLALVGPTASGKTAVTLALANLVDPLEAVAADSMTVYRHMDIGTASPSAAERARVPHHLIDLAEPDDEFSVARFQQAANRAFDDISQRGAHTILVGGTGLYHQSVIDDLDLPGRYPEVAAELEAEAVSEAGIRRLHARLTQLDPTAATRMEPTNGRRVVRALEVSVGSGHPFSSFGPGMEAYPPTPFVLVGLKLDRAVTTQRIEERFVAMMDAGLLDEVRALLNRPGGLSRTAAQALGYRELAEHLRGERTLDDAVSTAIVRTRKFAVRQERWFRRDPRLTWVDGEADAATVAVAVHQVWAAAGK